MSNMIIVRPLPISAITDTNSAGTGIDNLLTPDPKEVWVDGSTAVGNFFIDLGSAQLVDTFFLGFTNATTAAVWDVSLATGMTAGSAGAFVVASGTAMRFPDASGAVHAIARLATPVYSRYFRIRVSDVVSGLRIGVLAAGLAFQPAYNREWGSGRQPIDTGGKEPLLGGGFGIGAGAKKAGYRWTLGDLSDSETQALYALAKEAGETSPVIVVEDPDFSTGTLVADANTSLTGRNGTKTGGGSAFNAQIVTSDGRTAGAIATIKPGQITGTGVFFGLSKVPGTSANFGSVDYGVDTTGGNLSVFRLGVAPSPSAAGSFVVGDAISLVRQHRLLRVLKNGSEVFAMDVGVDAQSETLYFDSSFFEVGAVANNISLLAAGLNDRIHYGPLDRIEAYERTSPGNTRWSMSLVEWV